MLETIREYAAERLAEPNDADLRRRHAEQFVAVAQRARDGSSPGARRRQRGFALLDAEADNVRAALAWTDATASGALRARIAVSSVVLARPTLGSGARAPRLRALSRQGRRAAGSTCGCVVRRGHVRARLGELARATPQLETARALARELGDADEERALLHGLGTAAVVTATSIVHAPCLRRAPNASPRWDRTGLPEGATPTSPRSSRRPEIPAARASCSSGASRPTTGQATGRVSPGSTAGLGDLELAAGRASEALARYSTALPVHAEQGEPYTTAACLGAIAAAAATLGGAPTHRVLWGAVERLEHEAGFTLPEFDRAFYLRLLGEPDAEEAAAGRRLPAADAVALAESLSAASSMH